LKRHLKGCKIKEGDIEMTTKEEAGLKGEGVELARASSGRLGDWSEEIEG
jgi:hypothetical protein